MSEGQGARNFEQNRVSGTSAACDAVTGRRAPFAVLPGWFEAALLGPAEVVSMPSNWARLRMLRTSGSGRRQCVDAPEQPYSTVLLRLSARTGPSRRRLLTRSACV